VDAAFESFGKRCHDHDDVLIAGRAVRIEWSSYGLRDRFLPALAHLRGPETAPELTLCCWSGEGLPAPPWRAADFVSGSYIRGHIVGPLVATYDADGQLFQLHDRPGRRGLFHVADPARLPDWHDRSPFRPFISRFADDEGLALLHGACVGEGGGAVVLAGTSGSGKSTTGLSCVLAGMDFLGDDACLVDGDEVWSLYRLAKLEPDAAARLDATVLRLDVEGASVLAPPRVRRSAKLGAVLLIDIARTPDSKLSDPLGPEAALPALVRTLEAENKGVTPAATDALRSLVSRIPVRRLLVGSDRERVVGTVRRALA
jgi:hypothetical protein